MLNHPDLIEGMRPMYVPKDAGGGRPVIHDVVSEADGKVTFVRAGGGALYTAPEAEFLQYFEPLPADAYRLMMNQWEPGIAHGDWFAEDAAGIPAYFTDASWNGFACPAFEKDDMIAAIDDGRVDGVRWMADVEAFLEIDTCGEPIPDHDYAAEAKTMVEDNGYRAIKVGDLEIELCLVSPQSVVTQDGPKLVYPVGSHAWCWWREEPAPAPAPGR